MTKDKKLIYALCKVCNDYLYSTDDRIAVKRSEGASLHYHSECFEEMAGEINTPVSYRDRDRKYSIDDISEFKERKFNLIASKEDIKDFLQKDAFTIFSYLFKQKVGLDRIAEAIEKEYRAKLPLGVEGRIELVRDAYSGLGISITAWYTGSKTYMCRSSIQTAYLF